jgi:hypothetical protein
MKRFRVRQWGQDDWTYITIRGELAEGLHNMLAHALGGWTGKLHIQEFNERWENLE